MSETQRKFYVDNAIFTEFKERTSELGLKMNFWFPKLLENEVLALSKVFSEHKKANSAVFYNNQVKSHKAKPLKSFNWFYSTDMLNTLETVCKKYNIYPYAVVEQVMAMSLKDTSRKVGVKGEVKTFTAPLNAIEDALQQHKADCDYRERYNQLFARVQAK